MGLHRARRRADARKRKAVKVLHPSAAERSYEKALRLRVKKTHASMMARLEPLLKAREREESRKDADEQLDLFAEILTKEESDALAISNGSLAKTAGDVDTFTTKQIARTLVGAPVPVGLKLTAPATATRARWVKENVKLIESIDSRYYKDINRLMRESLESGRSTKSIRKELLRRFQVSEARAQLIARDQIAKLNGDITKFKQKKAGIKSYTWSTSGDERVRPTHEANDGVVFQWDDPPATGHPGEDFQCRCVALPVFEDD